MSAPRLSVIVPAYDEGSGIISVIDRLLVDIPKEAEVLVVVDFPEDSTLKALAAVADPRVRGVVSSYGRGPANAIRFGVDQVAAPVFVVTMADGSDDPSCIEPMVRLVERGVVIAAASRYMPGGAQVGAPAVKGLLSRGAGLSLRYFAGVGTHDATNSFKAYDTAFVREVGIESSQGFEIAIELVAKARRLRRPIAEVPTIWLERESGVSNFQLRRWLPEYLRWYRFAYGPRLTIEGVRGRPARHASKGSS